MQGRLPLYPSKLVPARRSHPQRPTAIVWIRRQRDTISLCFKLSGLSKVTVTISKWVVWQERRTALDQPRATAIVLRKTAPPLAEMSVGRVWSDGRLRTQLHLR